MLPILGARPSCVQAQDLAVDVDLRATRRLLAGGEEQTVAIQTQTRISNEAYARLALAEPDRKWELWDGVPREKPGMTAAHNYFGAKLGFMLMSQLDWSSFEVRIDSVRVQRSQTTFFIPDLVVVPAEYVSDIFDEPGILESYSQPLPLSAEVWSRTTGDFDIGEKLRTYHRRGDAEIWFLHPYERTLRSSARQPDGKYFEALYREGLVRPHALPNVEIDLAVLFAR